MQVRWTAALATLALAVSTASAGVFEDIFRGLQIVATPSGFPLFQSGDGGLTNGQRFGRVRIIPDRAGEGWQLEFDRTFGPDIRGRPETLDLGVFDLTLSGGVSSTLGYTSRGNFKIGNANTTFNNLSYLARLKTGAQDLEITGQLAGATNLEINQLGFYDLSVNLNNSNANFTADGVILSADEATEFTIGPINVSGNIYWDLAVRTLNSLGVDTTEIEKIFPASPIDEINKQLNDSFADQAARLGIDVTGGTSLEIAPVDSATTDAATESLLSTDSGQLAPVPEPQTLALLAIGAAMFLRRR